MIYNWLSEKIPHCSFVKAKHNDDMLIVCSDDLMMYYLNSTAALFIELADGKTTVNEIKQKFLETYDVAEQEVEDDFIEMIRDLQWKNILTLE